jgi:hypothetical protein
VLDRLLILGIIAFWTVVLMIAVRRPAEWRTDWYPKWWPGSPKSPRRNVWLVASVVGIVAGAAMLLRSLILDP